MRAADPQVDRARVEALVAAADPLRVGVDLLPDRLEVSEALPRLVEELAPLLGPVDELEDERPPRDDATPARQEGLADDVLQDARLAA